MFSHPVMLLKRRGAPAPAPTPALSFNGVDAYVEIPHDPIFDVTDTLTVKCWLKPRGIVQGSPNYHYIVSKIDNPYQTGGWSLTYEASDRISFGVGLGNEEGYAARWTPPELDRWYDIRAEIDASETRIYADGELVATGPGGPVRTNTFPIKFMGGLNGRYTSGELRDVEILHGATTLGHWKLDEGSGTTAFDSSPNGNDGTIVGATWVVE